MPCMGPNLEAARAQGRKVAEEMFDRLLKEHGLLEPAECPVVLPHRIGDWKATKKKFIESVEEIFVEEACNTY